MQAFESGKLDVPHFYFTGDDYRYRFDAEAKRRFIDLLRERFNSGVKYKDQVLRWCAVIERKATELGRLLTGKVLAIDFADPCPVLERIDDLTLRTRILSLTQKEANDLGIGKSTLHYLRASARDDRAFRTFIKVRRRIKQCKG